MTFAEFVKQMDDLQHLKHYHWEKVWMSPWFAFNFGFILFTVIVWIYGCMIANSEYEKSQQNILMKATVRILEKEIDVFLWWVVALLVSCVIIICQFWYVGVHFNDIKGSQDALYIQYMEQQNDVKIPVLDVTLQNPYPVARDATSVMEQNTYIFPNAVCSNCKRSTVWLKHAGDKEYTEMEVLVSFTLQDKDSSYILTKEPLREKVGPFDSDALYNPILFVPKSMGGY